MSDEINNRELVEEALEKWFEERMDIRADIDTALYVYNFLAEIDPNDVEILQWGMKENIQEGKEKCLRIIFKSISDLAL
jgi:predicted lipid carrier protein YhbT